MELLDQMNTQLLFPVAAVAIVLICAALVFVFGFHSAEQPQFDKLPLVVDDRKSSSKKKKTKDKKSSPNRTSTEDTKAKSEVPKKSPAKEKKEEKIKEQEKPKPKEKPVEIRVVKKETSDVKKGKKNKAASELEKPVDFDDAGWQEVPKKSDKKKVKTPEDKEKNKKESPAKKNKKKAKDADIEAARITEDVPEDSDKAVDAESSSVDEDAATALLAKVKEFQRVLREAERREQEALGAEIEEEAPAVEELTEVKDLRSNKKKENKEKQIKKKANEVAALTKATAKMESAEKDSSESSEKQDDKQNAPVFDELGDTWTDAKASKKSKKKARKDQ